jgi:hypothetical protein
VRTLLDDINDLLAMGVGQTVRLKIIKDEIQSRKSLGSADVHYVEELSRSFLQTEKKSSTLKNDKIIIIGAALALGLFFVFFIVPLPDDNPTPEEITPLDSATADDLPASAEVSSAPEEIPPTLEESLSANTEFSSANVIHSSSSTQT